LHPHKVKGKQLFPGGVVLVYLISLQLLHGILKNGQPYILFHGFQGAVKIIKSRFRQACYFAEGIYGNRRFTILQPVQFIRFTKLLLIRIERFLNGLNTGVHQVM